MHCTSYRDAMDHEKYRTRQHIAQLAPDRRTIGWLVMYPDPTRGTLNVLAASRTAHPYSHRSVACAGTSITEMFSDAARKSNKVCRLVLDAQLQDANLRSAIFKTLERDLPGCRGPFLPWDFQKMKNHQRIELPPGMLLDFPAGASKRHRLAVGPVGGHRIEGIGQGDNSRGERDRVAL